MARQENSFGYDGMSMADSRANVYHGQRHVDGSYYYLDKGFQVVEKLILDLWSKEIEDSVVTKIDAKTKLQELSLKRFKKLPSYKVISNTGPRHQPIFKVGVKLVNTKFYYGEGKSKKDAEQNAAINCLNNIKDI